MLIVFAAMAIFGWGWSFFGVVNVGLVGVILTVLYIIGWNVRRAAAMRTTRYDESRAEARYRWEVQEKNRLEEERERQNRDSENDEAAGRSMEAIRGYERDRDEEERKEQNYEDPGSWLVQEGERLEEEKRRKEQGDDGLPSQPMD